MKNELSMQSAKELTTKLKKRNSRSLLTIVCGTSNIRQRFIAAKILAKRIDPAFDPSGWEEVQITDKGISLPFSGTSEMQTA